MHRCCKGKKNGGPAVDQAPHTKKNVMSLACYLTRGCEYRPKCLSFKETEAQGHHPHGDQHHQGPRYAVLQDLLTASQHHHAPQGPLGAPSTQVALGFEYFSQVETRQEFQQVNARPCRRPRPGAC